jgi:hypothetical protein
MLNDEFLTPRIAVETATCLANASRFRGLRRKCGSEFPE